MIHTLTSNPAIDRLLVVPKLQVGKHIQVTRAAATPAGKGVNIARYLNCLRIPAMAWALVGQRELVWFREVLTAQGLGTGLFPLHGSTRQNMTIAQQSGPETHFREPGPEVTKEEWMVLAGQLAAYVQAGDTLAVAGSVPKGITPGMLLDLTVPIARRAAVIVDMNGPAAKAYFQKTAGVWIKGNAEEFLEMSGEKLSAKSICNVLGEHPQLKGIIVTDSGSEIYAACVSGGEVPVFRVKPPKVKKVLSTVGAGDAFTAGLCAKGIAGTTPEQFAETVRYAAAIASASLSESAVGVVDSRLAETLLAGIKVRKG